MFRQIAFAAGLSMAATAGFAQTAETPAQGGGAAPAQKAPQAARIDPAAAYEAARNQLGILKYCQSQGFSGAEAVSAQQKLVGMLPEGDAQAGAAALMISRTRAAAPPTPIDIRLAATPRARLRITGFNISLPAETIKRTRRAPRSTP